MPIRCDVTNLDQPEAGTIWGEVVDVADAIKAFDTLLAQAEPEHLHLEEIAIETTFMRVRFNCDPLVRIPLGATGVESLSKKGYSYRFIVDAGDNVDFMEFAGHIKVAGEAHPEICSDQVTHFIERQEEMRHHANYG